MRKEKTFRPIVTDTLEDRTVPSGGTGDWLSGLIGSVPAQDAQQVRQAFYQFERSYASDVFNVLYGSGGPSATTRTAFDTQVATDLGTLETAIDTAIGNLSTASTLTTTIHNELFGTGTTTLQGQLAAIPTPTSTSGHGYWSGAWHFVGTGEWDIAQSARTVSQQVATAPAPTGTIDVATVQSILKSVGKSFQTFQTSYTNDLKNILYANGGPNATTRAAFDTQVAADIATLTTSVTSALTASGLSTPLPSSLVTSLTATLTADLQTPSSNPTGASLQEQLAALTTPSSNYFSKLWFRFNSNWTVGSTQSQVTWDIINAVKTYNSSLS